MLRISNATYFHKGTLLQAIKKRRLRDMTIAALFAKPLSAEKIEPSFQCHEDIPEYLREYNPTSKVNSMDDPELASKSNEGDAA